jgi:hypothetical protein
VGTPEHENRRVFAAFLKPKIFETEERRSPANRPDMARAGGASAKADFVDSGARDTL